MQLKYSMVGSKRCRQEMQKVAVGEWRLAVNPVKGQVAIDNDGQRMETSCQSCKRPNHIVPKG
jgi:hypothetical protein